MTVKNNADYPASPLLLDTKHSLSGGSVADDWFEGLTKRELFCLHMGVAETGDAELDAIIRKGNRQKMAMAAMQGVLVPYTPIPPSEVADCAVRNAGALLAKLER